MKALRSVLLMLPIGFRSALEQSAVRVIEVYGIESNEESLLTVFCEISSNYKHERVIVSHRSLKQPANI